MTINKEFKATHRLLRNNVIKFYKKFEDEYSVFGYLKFKNDVMVASYLKKDFDKAFEENNV